MISSEDTVAISRGLLGAALHCIRKLKGTDSPTYKAVHDAAFGEALTTPPVNQDDDAFERAPKHKYWWAGEQGCPSDIKAGNGELRTLRCKICELDNPHDTICHADVHFAALTAEKAK